jgi:hypothetical protein
MRTRLSIAIAPLMLALVACGDRDTTRGEAGGDAALTPVDSTPDRETQVRVVNAVPGGPAVDVYTGDQNTFSNVGFKTVTPYKVITENRPTFKLLRTGEATGAPMAENTELVLDGRAYTVIVVADSSGKEVELEALRDDMDPPAAGKARLRVINAASKAGDLDVFIEGTSDPLFDDVNVNTEAGYKEVEPGTPTLVIRGADENSTTRVRVANLALEAGKSMTLVVTHPSASSTRLEVIKVMDEAPAGSAMPADTSKPDPGSAS